MVNSIALSKLLAKLCNHLLLLHQCFEIGAGTNSKIILENAMNRQMKQGKEKKEREREGGGKQEKEKRKERNPPKKT